MSSSHNFHIRDEHPVVKFYDGGEVGALQILNGQGSTDITIFYWGVSKEQLQRACEAFATEMQRDPVAQQQAAE